MGDLLQRLCSDDTRRNGRCTLVCNSVQVVTPPSAWQEALEIPATDRQQLMLEAHRSTNATMARVQQSLGEEHASLIKVCTRGRGIVQGSASSSSPSWCSQCHSRGAGSAVVFECQQWCILPSYPCEYLSSKQTLLRRTHGRAPCVVAAQAGGAASGDGSTVCTGLHRDVPMLRRRSVPAQVRPCSLKRHLPHRRCFPRCTCCGDSGHEEGLSFTVVLALIMVPIAKTLPQC